MPVSASAGAFVPGKGWVIFGGNATFNQTQHLLTIDGTWSIGEPAYQPDAGICIVQVRTNMYKKSNF
jgi:hypothetical protein